MTDYERKREYPEESYGASIVPCKEDWVYDCPGCDEYISLRIPGVNIA